MAIIFKFLIHTFWVAFSKPQNDMSRLVLPILSADTQAIQEYCKKSPHLSLTNLLPFYMAGPDADKERLFFLETMRPFLKTKEDANAKCENGFTPIFYTLIYLVHELQSYATNVRSGDSNNFSHNELLEDMKIEQNKKYIKKFEESIKLLLDSGADVHIKNNDGVSPFEYAMKHKASLKALIDPELYQRILETAQ